MPLGLPLLRSTAAVALACFALACNVGTPDPRTVEGVLAYASRAIEAGDAHMLFRVIDARSRHAMISIVADRRRAKQLVEASYPPDLRPAALAALGDAADATDAADLFAKRCDARCRSELAAGLGAPSNVERRGEETHVTTTRGRTLVLRGGGSDWFGFVWNTEALYAERERANRDLRMIEANAATYDRRRALGSGAAPGQPSSGE